MTRPEKPCSCRVIGKHPDHREVLKKSISEIGKI